MKTKGYINFIGPDGSGKDTAYEKIIELFPDAIVHREPGGSPISERIREVILSNDKMLEERIREVEEIIKNKDTTELTKAYLHQANEEMKSRGLSGDAEVFLYAASRAQTNETLVLPALKEDKLILGRRSVACSMSYQGHARGLGMDNVWQANSEAVKGCLPTLEIYFDVPIETVMERISQRTEKQDRLDNEGMEFHKKTIDGYHKYYKEYCPYPYVFIDATKSIEEVYSQVKKTLEEHFKKLNQ